MSEFMSPKFSLILCTLGRSSELADFFRSLEIQEYQTYELIIVDQNVDDRVLKELEKFPLVQSKSVILRSLPGLSRARNVGLEHASGDIIAFPDDDCIYGEGLLVAVAEYFTCEGRKESALCVNTKDPVSEFSLIPSPHEPCQFDRHRLLGCSFTLFFSQMALAYRFDERLGVGSGFIWGASEEHDFLYRFLGDAGVGGYCPDLWVYHPAKEHQQLDIKRAYYYGGGLAAFRAKHFSAWRCCSSVVFILFQIIKLSFSLKFKGAAFKTIYLTGYIFGLLAWKVAIR